MKTLAEFSTSRRITILMITLGVCTFGWFSFQRLEIKLLPDISYPAITVRTDFPGSSPEEVETLVSKPVEESLGVLNNLKQITSISTPGNSDVVLEFNWDMKMDRAVMDIREKLDSIVLPEQSKRPRILRYNPETDPIMRIFISGEDLIAVRRYAENELKAKLESLDGVASAQILGGDEEEISVEIDPNRLAAMDISYDDVARRLREENINLPGGVLKDGNTEYLVRTVNAFQTVEEIGTIIVGGVTPAAIRLKDIASVNRRVRDKSTITHLTGDESVAVYIYKEGDANLVETARRLKDYLSQLRSDASGDAETYEPVPGIRLEIISDSSVFINAAINEVKQNAVIGGILAVLVLYLFLKRLGHTSIITVAIPVSIVSTFALMDFKHISLNLMSLGGLALGVGMLVDNSIVVLESIVRKRESGCDAVYSATGGTNEVSSAVTASTLTTIAVFFPIVFVSGLAGQVFHDLAYTVAFSLIASLTVSLTLIPMISSFGVGSMSQDLSPLWIADNLNRSFLGNLVRGIRTRLRSAFSDYFPVHKQHKTLPAHILFIAAWPFRLLMAVVSILLQTVAFVLTTTIYLLFALIGSAAVIIWKLVSWLIQPLLKLFDHGFKSIKLFYSVMLKISLNNPVKVCVVSLLLFLLTMFGLGPRLGVSLLPSVSQGELTINVRLPAGAPVEETARIVSRVQKKIGQIPEVQRVSAVVGTTQAETWSIEMQRENTAVIHVLLNDKDEYSRIEGRAIPRIRSILEAEPRIESNDIRRSSIFTLRMPLEIEIQGRDIDQLQKEAERLMERLANVGELTELSCSLEMGLPEVQLSFDRERLSRVGIRLSQVAELLQNLVEGTVPTEYKEFENEIDIRVRAGHSRQLTVENLRNLVINADSTEPVLLGSVATIVHASGPNEIRRINQRRVVVVRADVGIKNLNQAIRNVQDVLSKMDSPPGISFEITGQNNEMRESVGSLLMAFGLAVFLVFLVMASQFEWLIGPLIILTSVPLAVIGVIAGLFILNIPVSIIVFIGLIVLAGIVVNNAILLMDAMKRLRGEGFSPRRAIIDAVDIRIRPIFMTTLTTVLGLVPMVASSGPGSEIREPLAWTVILGLTVSTFLTLVLIPTFVALIWRVRAE